MATLAGIAMTTERIRQLAAIAAQSGHDAGHVPSCEDCLQFLKENTFVVDISALDSDAIDAAIAAEIDHVENYWPSFHEFEEAFRAESRRLTA